MKWIKKGVIFTPDNNYDWMVTHAAVPVVELAGENKLRIYFSSRDKQGRSRIGFIEVMADDPSQVVYIHPYPIMELGELGTFDDNGMMPSSIIDYNGHKYLYYIGWNPGVTVSYRNSIGLAIANSGTWDFERYSPGPILDRSISEPFFTASPFVIKEESLWKLWYLSCTKWEIINSHPEPFYLIKYTESYDGINWNHGKICIDYDDFTEAISKPFILQEDSIYKMYYSFRSSVEYRTNRSQSYRLGYAESIDGISWVRKDREVGIEISASGWDSEMIEYPYIFKYKEKTFLFYNGNGFGKSGIGYAELSHE